VWALVGAMVVFIGLAVFGALSSLTTGRLDMSTVDAPLRLPLTNTPDQISSDSAVLSLADNMMVWHQAALVYAAANSGYVGVIPNASLAFPYWYSPQVAWVSVMGAGNVVVTYYAAGTGVVEVARLAWALRQRTSGYEGAGVVSGGLVSAGTAGPMMPVPASVPNGAAAIVMVVP